MEGLFQDAAGYIIYRVVQMASELTTLWQQCHQRIILKLSKGYSADRNNNFGLSEGYFHIIDFTDVTDA